MGYKLNGNSIYLDVPFTDSNGTQYPSNWLRNSSATDREAVPTGGITWEPEAKQYDQRFYYGANSPKPVADLKAVWIQEQKNVANSKLKATDWYVLRAAEGGTAVPSATTTLRANIRTKCKEREDQITACADTNAVADLIQRPEGAAGGLNPWPTS